LPQNDEIQGSGETARDEKNEPREDQCTVSLHSISDSPILRRAFLIESD